MAQIINNVVNKILTVVKEFFFAELYEYGTMTLTPADSGKQISVKCNGNVVKVWLSLYPHVDPYNDDHDSDDCYVGHPRVHPHGFTFKGNYTTICRLDWFVIEEPRF